METLADLVRVTFLKPHAAYGYFAGDKGFVSPDKLHDLQLGGFVMLYPGEDRDNNPLPDDLEGRAILFAYGIKTVKEAQALGMEGLIDLEKIGKATAKKIMTYGA